MNFIPETIQYDAEHDIYFVRMFYSAGRQESSMLLGATKNYLYELFKQPKGSELGKSFMNKWVKLSQKDLAKELSRVPSDEVYKKMYGVDAKEVEKGMEFLSQQV